MRVARLVIRVCAGCGADVAPADVGEGSAGDAEAGSPVPTLRPYVVKGTDSATRQQVGQVPGVCASVLLLCRGAGVVELILKPHPHPHALHAAHCVCVFVCVCVTLCVCVCVFVGGGGATLNLCCCCLRVISSQVGLLTSLRLVGPLQRSENRVTYPYVAGSSTGCSLLPLSPTTPCVFSLSVMVCACVGEGVCPVQL